MSCPFRSHDWQLSVLHNGNLYGCASTLLYEFHTMGIRNIKIWRSHLYLYWHFPYILTQILTCFILFQFLGNFRMKFFNMWVFECYVWDTHSLVSGLMMVTQSVFSYTLSSSGMPSHGICQEKNPNNRAQSVIEISRKGSYQYIWQKLKEP